MKGKATEYCLLSTHFLLTSYSLTTYLLPTCDLLISQQTCGDEGQTKQLAWRTGRLYRLEHLAADLEQDETMIAM